MRLFLLATLIFSFSGTDAVKAWMEQAFYPVLFSVLVVASLGVPIPEDVPLIAAGVLIKTYPGIATWPKTLAVALIGIMIGDLVLYMLGRIWGQDVLSHRSIRWLVPADRFERARGRFHRHGMWFCFFGRFFMGVRAVMCLAAGATHFPYWRFLIADLGGAMLSAPLFVLLGYWFAYMIPSLRKYLTDVQIVLWLTGAVVVFVTYALYRRRKAARRLTEALGTPSDKAETSTPSAAGVASPTPPQGPPRIDIPPARTSATPPLPQPERVDR